MYICYQIMQSEINIIHEYCKPNSKLNSCIMPLLNFQVKMTDDEPKRAIYCVK